MDLSMFIITKEKMTQQMDGDGIVLSTGIGHNNKTNFTSIDKRITVYRNLIRGQVSKYATHVITFENFIFQSEL